jgi:hypothetical protein
MCQSINGDIASGAFRVSGIYKTNNEPFDETHVYLRSDKLKELLGTGEAVHEIAVLLRDESQTEAIKAEYAGRWKDAELKSWMDLAPAISVKPDSKARLPVFIRMIPTLRLILPGRYHLHSIAH